MLIIYYILTGKFFKFPKIKFLILDLTVMSLEKKLYFNILLSATCECVPHSVVWMFEVFLETGWFKKLFERPKLNVLLLET